MCSARSGQTDEYQVEHLMAELEPFSDISSLWPRTVFQMTAPPSYFQEHRKTPMNIALFPTPGVQAT